MKSKTIFLLIISASFMVTTIETATCNNPIIYNNLNLPATINLAQLEFGRGFLPNKSIVINGVVLANPDLFVVNLFEDGVMQQTAEIPFHCKPLFRFNPTRVVRNNWIKSRGWGPEETSGGFPFRAGQPFVLEFVAAPQNTIIINVNNKRFATFTRVDLSKISQLYIDGRGTITVNSLTLCPNPVITTTTVKPTTTTKEPTTTTEDPTTTTAEPTTTTEEPTTTTEKPTTTTVEPTTTPLPTCPYPIVIAYPEIPATIDLLKQGFGEGFAPPKRIRFVGSPINTTDRFMINLYSDGVPDITATTVFHFNPRFKEKQVVRNTWSRITGWGKEERSGGFPFKVGEPFVLEFIAGEKNTIIVHVDYKPFVTFSRDDLSKLSTLEVKLAVELSSVVLCHDKPITTTIEPTTTTEEPTTTTEEPTTTTEEPTTTTTEKPTTTTPITTTKKPPTPTTKKHILTTPIPQYCPKPIVFNNLKIPSIINLVAQGFGRGFAPPKRIIILGTPTERTRFDINLAEDGVPEKTANILFHCNPRFTENRVVRDTWIRGKGWVRQELTGGFPFTVGQSFVLEFRAAPKNTINVFVNNKPFVNFARYDLSKISQLEIKQAVKITSVILCK